MPVDLQAVLNDVFAELELLIHEKRAVVQVSPMPTVPGNAQQLHQLFYNLVSNAIKFSSEERVPEITITANDSSMVSSEQAAETRFREITVTDNGIGFDQEQANRIFTVFERLHASKYEGTGIGLSLCKKVVTNHGGEISAVGQPGKGATFRVLLPFD